MNIGKITKHVKLHILQFKKAIVSDSKFKRPDFSSKEPGNRWDKFLVVANQILKVKIWRN